MDKRYEFRWVPCDPKADQTEEGFFGQTTLDELLKRHHAALSGLEVEHAGASDGIERLMRFDPADTLPVIQFD
jgi:hypothetical protein